MVRRYLRLGISPIVSTVLLILIIVSIGAVLVTSAYRMYSTFRSQVIEERSRIERELRQSLGVLLIRADSSIDKVTIVVVAADYPVKIYAIYINNTLVSEPNIELPPFEVSELEVNYLGLNSGDLLNIKIVYEGGRIEEWATAI